MKKIHIFALYSALHIASMDQLRAQELGTARINSNLLEINVFTILGDRSETWNDVPTNFPVLTMGQNNPDDPAIGFAVNCRGRDPRAVIQAFGEAFFDIQSPEGITEADLNALPSHITNQPFLRCDTLDGQNQVSPAFSQVFRVIDREAKKSYSLVRFNAFSPLDKRLFEVGCANILETFWKESKVRPIIPVLRENLKDLPGSENIGALHCFDSATPLTNNLSYGSFTEPEPVFDARLYRVEDPERGLVRVLLTGGKTFRLNCSAADGELQKAFGMPATGKLDTITTVDAAFNDYINGQMDEQPPLNCPSLSRPQFASDAYHVINFAGLDARTAARNPLLRLASAEDALVQFSCESATQFFAKKTLDELNTNPSKLLPMLWESTDYVVRKYLPGQPQTKHYQMGCAAGALAANEVKQLIRDVMGREPQSGELSSFMNQCSTQGAVCTKAWMEQQIVDRAKLTPQATARIIVAAFAGLGRVPQPEEMNYFQKKRVHYKELLAQLKTAKFLDRALFIEKMKTSAGAEYFMNALDIWTAKQLDNPTRVYTADLFKNEIEAYFKATHAYLDQIIHNAYDFKFEVNLPIYQINTMKSKVTSGAVRALFEDMTNVLNSTAQDCFTVAATKEDQTFAFAAPRYRVAAASGTWTADKSYYPLVGPVGHTGSDAAQATRLEPRYPLGQLLITTKNSAGAWVPWTGWNGGFALDHYFNEVKLVMNDYRSAFGDNNGSIKVCF